MSQIFNSAARNIQLLCSATRINLDPPDFHDSYVSFGLKHWHNIDGDFFVRAQSVGITLKNEDVNLFYLLQDALDAGDIELHLFGSKLYGTEAARLEPKVAGDGRFSPANPCTFYLASISSGNLRGEYAGITSRDPRTFDARADFLSNLLFTQWIVKMMPFIEMYKRFKRLDILVPAKPAEGEDNG